MSPHTQCLCQATSEFSHTLSPHWAQPNKWGPVLHGKTLRLLRG